MKWDGLLLSIFSSASAVSTSTSLLPSAAQLLLLRDQMELTNPNSLPLNIRCVCMLYIAACLLYSLLVSNSIRTHHYTSVRTLREIKHQIDVRRLEKKKNKINSLLLFLGGSPVSIRMTELTMAVERVARLCNYNNWGL